MEKTCIDYAFATADMCSGCERVTFTIGRQKTEEKKEIIRKKKRSVKNVCTQPWHVKFKDKPRTAKIRELLLRKYFKGVEGGIYKGGGTSVEIVNKFNRKSLKGKFEKYTIHLCNCCKL